MKRNLRVLVSLAIICIVTISIVMARGGGSSGGGGGKGSGGGGGGKGSGGGKNGGGTSDDPNSEWVTTTMYEDWQYANTGVFTDCGNGFNNGFPISTFGQNTHPYIGSQNLTNENYYCNILVENTGTGLPLAINQKNFARANSKQTQIQVPRFRSYRITYEFVEKCSRCMVPYLTGQLPYDEGRRMMWKSIQGFVTGQSQPTVYPSRPTNFLRSCN